MKVSIGSILKGFNVHRNDGTVERYDKPLHNYISQEHFSASRVLGSYSPSGGESSCSSDRYLGLSETKPSRLLGGISGGALGWNQTTKVLSNIDVFHNPGGVEGFAGLYVLETGEFAFAAAGSVASGTATLSNNSFGSSITGKRVYHFGNSSFATDRTAAGDASRTATYSNGVITSVNNGAQVVTLSANRTIYAIRMGGRSQETITDFFNIFDLDTPLNLLSGEQVSIGPGDFIVTYTFDDYQPRVFTALECPIAGISASGRFQRLLPVLAVDANPSTYGNEIILSAPDTRIWLLADANKITIPNFSPTVLEDSLIVSPIETMVPIYSGANYAANNDFTATFQIWGSVVIGGTTKQIICGKTNPVTPLGWVIEFDTPQVIPAGKILYFKTTHQILGDLVVPTYTANP